jgi:hypothetical protein
MGIVWWAVWRKDQFGIRGWRRFTVNSAIVLATLTLLASTTLKVSRNDLMPICAGMAILFLLRRLIDGKLAPAFLLKFVAIFVSGITALFSAISALRSAPDLDALIGNVLGYTIGSYNRMAALLDGRLQYPFSGRGIFISQFVAFNETFNKVFHINQLLAWPDAFAVWGSQFAAVAVAGLDGSLIWAGAFGYIYSDLGWLAPALLFIHGLITGWAWRALKRGTTAGVLLYPWCAFSVLFWFGMNDLIETKSLVLFFLVIALGFYEFLFVRSSVKFAQEPRGSR